MTAGRSIGTQPYAALAVDIYAEKLNAGKPLSILFRPAAELRGFGDLWHLRLGISRKRPAKCRPRVKTPRSPGVSAVSEPEGKPVVIEAFSGHSHSDFRSWRSTGRASAPPQAASSSRIRTSASELPFNKNRGLRRFLREPPGNLGPVARQAVLWWRRGPDRETDCGAPLGRCCGRKAHPS